MAIKTILVTVHGLPIDHSTVETAFEVAEPFGAHVVGIHLQPTAEQDVANVMMSRASVGMSHDRIRSALDEAQRKEMKETDLARAAFDDAAAKWGARIIDKPDGDSGLSAAFRVVVGGIADTVANAGRVFDLIVAPQPKIDPSKKLRNALRAALLEAGRPVLVTPERPFASVGKAVLVAWNGSALSARAAAIARQHFIQAERVGIFTADTGSVEGASAEDLADYLAWHGVEASVRRIDLGRSKLGDAIMADAHEFEADLLVMGAYSQSAFRDALTGGLTNYILSHASLPVLMAH